MVCKSSFGLCMLVFVSSWARATVCSCFCFLCCNVAMMSEGNRGYNADHHYNVAAELIAQANMRVDL